MIDKKKLLDILKASRDATANEVLAAVDSNNNTDLVSAAARRLVFIQLIDLIESGVVDPDVVDNSNSNKFDIED